MNIGMDGMILMGAFFGVLGSWLFASAAAGVALAVGVGLLVGLFFALFVVKLRSDEFIIGCALNTFALGLTGFLSRSIFGASGTKGNPFLPSLRLPGIESIPFLGKILSGNSLFVYLTLLFVLLLWAVSSTRRPTVSGCGPPAKSPKRCARPASTPQSSSGWQASCAACSARSQARTCRSASCRARLPRT